MITKKFCYECVHTQDIPKFKSKEISLNYDCLENVFLYLPIEDRLNVEKVCKKWKNASKFTWTSIKNFNSCDGKFVYENFKFPPKQLQLKNILIRCGIYLTSLSLNWEYDSKIMLVVRNCCNLIKLKLHLNFYDNNDFIGVYEKMKKLKSIEIIDNSADYYGHNILESLPEGIEEILLSSRCTGQLIPPNIAMTIRNSKSLRFLKLQNFTLENNVMNFVTQSKTLSHLDLRGSILLEKRTWLSNLGNLEFMGLSFVSTIDDKFMISIAGNCKNLNHIDLSNCKNISKHGLNQLGHLKNLEKVLLNGVNQVDDSIISKFNRLKILECFYCTGVTDDSIVKILKNSPALERLNIFKTRVTRKTLDCASNLTKIRKDNHKLNVIVHDFPGFNNTSPLLIIAQF